MSDNDSRTGSNAGVVILIAAVVLAVPCCGGLALVGAALFGVRTSVRSAPPPMLAPVQPLPAPQAAPMPTAVVESESPPEPAGPEDAQNLEHEKSGLAPEPAGEPTGEPGSGAK